MSSEEVRTVLYAGFAPEWNERHWIISQYHGNMIDTGTFMLRNYQPVEQRNTP